MMLSFRMYLVAAAVEAFGHEEWSSLTRSYISIDSMTRSSLLYISNGMTKSAVRNDIEPRKGLYKPKLQHRNHIETKKTYASGLHSLPLAAMTGFSAAGLGSPCKSGHLSSKTRIVFLFLGLGAGLFEGLGALLRRDGGCASTLVGSKLVVVFVLMRSMCPRQDRTVGFRTTRSCDVAFPYESRLSV